MNWAQRDLRNRRADFLSLLRTFHSFRRLLLQSQSVAVFLTSQPFLDCRTECLRSSLFPPCDSVCN